MNRRELLLATACLVACGDSSGTPGALRDAAVDAQVARDASTPSDTTADATTDTMADGSFSDAGAEACDALPIPRDCPPLAGNALPQDLRCTGLYADWAARQVACGIAPYTPAYTLWSDGADKQRYLWLPPGTTIDVSNPDGFVFPEGTRLWKEFRIIDGDHLRLGETRLLVKRKDVWSMTTYVWSEDESRAVQTNDGVADLYGTGHTVPTRDECDTCHGGRADFVLGFDPIMLGAGASGLTLQTLRERHQLRDPSQPDGAPSASLFDAVAPGDATESAALGYLHANCGVSCHNQEAFADAKLSGLNLRLEHGEYENVASTDAFETAINQAYGDNATLPPGPVPAGGYLRVRPTDPSRSLLLARMKVRGPAQMPRIGTNTIDDVGIAAVQRWIEQMSTARGYPAPLP